MRGFWEQTGLDRFPVQPGDNPESCEFFRAFVQAVLDEKVKPAGMVALAKEWHIKVGVCDDVQCCGCCGVRELQQVQQLEVSKLELLNLNDEQLPWYP